MEVITKNTIKNKRECSDHRENGGEQEGLGAQLEEEHGGSLPGCRGFRAKPWFCQAHSSAPCDPLSVSNLLCYTFVTPFSFF